MASGGGGGSDFPDSIRDQFLQCKICLDGLKEPKTLPCLHTFCADCIHYYIGHNRLDDRKFACPICRRHIYIPKHGVDGFPDSFFVTNLNDMVMEQMQKNDSTAGCDDSSAEGSSKTECGICKFKESSVTATSLCVDCKINLCEDCGKSHGEAKITSAHTLLPLQQAQASGSGVGRDNYCRIHKGETIKFYCETCNSCICLPCTFLDHKEHEIQEIKKVREEFSSDMDGLVLQSSDNILQLASVKDDLSDLENELFMRKESIKSEVRRKMQDIVHTLRDQESQLMIQIDEFYETIAVARDRQRIERTIYRLEHAHDFAKQLLSPETSPISQLTNRKEAKDNLEKSLTYELPNVMLHAMKLDKYIHFLPGKLDAQLGTLLKCTEPGKCNTISETRPVLPSTKALYLHKLRPSDGVTMGEVVAMAFLPSGNLVILTNLAKKVRIYGTKGQLKYEFGDDGELQSPSDLVITRDGEIAITDLGGQCVRIFDQFGTPMGQIGGPDMFSMPISITKDKVGKFLVCDQAKLRITVHRFSGDIIHEFNIPETTSPQFISYCNDKLYICDPENKTVHLYVYMKAELQYVAKLSTNENHFLDCAATTVDASGNLLIADSTVDKILLYNPKGEMSSVLPSGRQFLRPNCMCVSAGGMLAVSQQGRYMECVEGGGEEQEVGGASGSSSAGAAAAAEQSVIIEEEEEEIAAGTEVCVYRVLRDES